MVVFINESLGDGNYKVLETVVSHLKHSKFLRWFQITAENMVRF